MSRIRVAPEDAKGPKVIKQMEYAFELECADPDTRHFKHPWCFKHNEGMNAEKLPIMPADMPATIPTIFNHTASLKPQKLFMGVRAISRLVHNGTKIYWYKGAYDWRTYSQVFEDVQAAAKGLLSMKPALAGAGEGIAAILAETSPEWQVAHQSASQVGFVITTVYTTLGHEAMVHGLNETECSVLFLDFGRYKILKEPVLSKCPSIKLIVFIGKCWVPETVVGGEPVSFPTAAETAAMPKVLSAGLTTLDGLIEAGRKSTNAELAKASPGEGDLAFIMYTSGSTGMPKGVMLSHKNFIAVIAGIVMHGSLEGMPDDTYVAYLPLAHILELICEFNMLYSGAKIGYASPKTLTPSSVFMAPDNPEGSDLLVLKPTVLVAVPAILDLIKSGLLSKLKGLEGFKGKLVRTAVNKAQGKPGQESARANLLCFMGATGPVLKKVKKQLGLDGLRVIVSGSAPLAAETHCFISQVLAPVSQGYGCTETLGRSTCQEVFSKDGRRYDRSSDTVGSFNPCGELKLKSVPDMGYLVTDDPPRGEILLGGENVSQKGYFKMKEKTEEDFPYHEDGKRWFHTGDIGCLTANGTLRIIDRKKDLIKLSAGEYVSLGKVEAALKQVKGIGACVVFARPDKDHCVAIVSQPEKGWASVGGKPDEMTLLKAIGESLRNQKLARFEIPQAVKVDDMIWTPDSGLTTASMKLQRHPLRMYYNQPGGLLEQMNYQL